MSQLVFGQHVAANDPWCRHGSQRAWAGVDLSACFHTKFIDGIIPIIYIGLSVSVLFLTIVQHFVKRPAPAIPLAKGTARRLSESSLRNKAQAEDEALDQVTIAEAENEVILQVVLEESPDLNRTDLLKFTGQKKGSNGYLSVPAEDDDSIEEEQRAKGAGFFGAIWRTKKDLFNVAGSATLIGLHAWRFAAQRGSPGSNWFIFPMTAWAWTTVLAIVKLGLAFSTALRSDSSRMPQRYSHLELHIIPFYMIYTLVALLDFRTSLLIRHAIGREAAILGVVFALTTIEFVSSRPSRYLPKGASRVAADGRPVSPELEASLLSLTFFSFMDSYLFSFAFSKNKTPITLDTIPDLRPDDKTARTLLDYRRNTAWITKRWPKAGMTPKLLWFFKGPLLLQQLWSLLRVSVIALPSLLLQAFLIHLGKMKRGEDAPAHIAYLIVGAQFFVLLVSAVAQSQSLYIGRRVAVRLRSIITGEVFTKALRRKDQAGASKKDESTEEKEVAKVEGDSEGENEKATSGKIMNLISVDTFRVSEICAYLHYVFPEMSLTIVVCIALLFQVLGWSALAGLITMILISPLSAAASKLFVRFQERLLKAADSRINLATEVISSVRIVKYFAWERKFIERMDVTREQELSAIWLRALCMVCGGIVFSGTPIVVSAITFIVHTKVLHRPLTAEAAFTSLSLFNVLRTPLEGLVDMIINILQALVSIRRIDEFLAEEETAKYDILKRPSSTNDPVIGFTDASFTWSGVDDALEDPSVFRIADLNLNFPVGKMSIILGPVGSGKTTLLLSLLGETNRLEGAAFLPSPVVRSSGTNPSILTESTAFCAQSPWLLSDTIKENILFGSTFDEARYKKVLFACALEPDLKQFELGDLTEVGEKGTVLSGGQKARISLARAIYSPARHVLLDDVLSAVDSHTAQHLYDNCFHGKLMRNRTCILVTHAVDLCLPGSSYVVSMEHGRVTSAGPPSSIPVAVIKAKDDKARENEIALASAITIEAIAEDETDEAIRAREADELRKRQKNKLIQDETQAEGAVSFDVYKLYIRALGGWIVIVLSMVMFVVAQLAEIAVSLALRYWAQTYDEAQSAVAAANIFVSLRQLPSQSPSGTPMHLFTSSADNTSRADFWLWTYVVVGVFSVLSIAVRNAYTLHRAVIASRYLYTCLMNSILGAPIRFFDSTPTGRILNRLSKDIETVDQDLAPVLQFFVMEVMASLGTLATIVVALPKFFFAAIVIILVYWLIGYIYLGPSRDIKRCESVSKSPIMSTFTELLNGVSTIRAYGDLSRFARKAFAAMNANNRPFFLLWQSNRWLAARVDIAGACVTLTASLFVLWAGGIDASLAGFIVSFAMAFNDRILWVVRMYSIVEINFNSLERVNEYLTLNQENKGGVSPPAIWPSREGKIEVEGLTASYAPDLPPVLKNVTFTVEPREKVGICGRTGSGKSTLGLSFFRFIEPSSGQIKIDGLSINDLKLADLRSRLTIVAQEAALFAGTLRFNLDPFDQYEDKEIWDALKRVHLASEGAGVEGASGSATPRTTTGGNGGTATADSGSDSGDTTTLNGAVQVGGSSVIKSLDMMVTEGGKNFSAGQRQLISLCRGLLKLRNDSHILILDESTASLDSATDDKIQETIRTEMADATILCIAHRLRTIIDYDKILVLGDGEVIEYAAPWDLLDNEESAFSALCKKSGEYETLKNMAEAARLRHSKTV